MKTFEERYTAWIDGQLDGPALTAFELELSRRAAAGEARADRREAGLLHSLLTAHLQAPPITNADFFNHQLRERIEADQRAEQRRGAPRERAPLFAWSFARLVGLGAAFLFAASALYYGLIPHSENRSGSANVGAPAHSGGLAAVGHTPVPVLTSPTTPAVSDKGDQPLGTQLAKRDPLPDNIEETAPDIQKVQVSEQAKTTTATPLHYQKPDVNVLWINGLDYMSSVPGDTPADKVAPSVQP